jgi:predicted RND superfamily exporter protein
MHRLWPSLLRRSTWTLGITLLLTLVFLVQIKNLQFDTSPSTLILPDSAETAYHERIARIFGNDQIILIGIRGEDFLSAPELSRIRKLTADLEAIGGLFSSSELREEIDRIERRAGELFPAGFQVHVTGSLVLMNQTSDRVSTEQDKSLALSTALIAIIVILLSHSWKVGLISLLPAGFPILLCFGLMGWTGIYLNVNTSVIASIAIDNCVHNLVHFQRSFHRGLSIAGASRQSLMDSGGPIVASAIAQLPGASRVCEKSGGQAVGLTSPSPHGLAEPYPPDLGRFRTS